MPETTRDDTAYPRVFASYERREDLEAALTYLNAEAIPREQVSVRSGVEHDPGTPAESGEPLREDEARNLRTMRTSMAAAGAGMAAAGAVIATGGAALPAVVAAVAAGGGAGALSEGASGAAASEGEAPSAQRVGVVVVSPANADQSERAKGVLGKTSATRVWVEGEE